MKPAPDFETAAQYIFGRLERELSPTLRYHSIYHTRDDVLPAVERLLVCAGIADGENALLLRTAALYHDVGYLKQYVDNEPIAAHIAALSLPDFGYSVAQIERIQSWILATQMPQAPQDDWAALLCDADMDSLGRDDYLEITYQLRAELMLHGNPFIPLLDWYQQQHTFISSHVYFTQYARTLRDVGKRANIALLERLLGEP